MILKKREQSFKGTRQSKRKQSKIMRKIERNTREEDPNWSLRIKPTKNLELNKKEKLRCFWTKIKE
jgi:hypothetical protein